MLVEVHLHGSAARRFGGPYRLDAATPIEAIRGIAAQVPGFWNAITTGVWRISRGALENEGMFADALGLQFGRCREIHVVPAAEGAGKGGIGKIVIGVAIAAAAIIAAPATGGGSLAAGAAASGAAGGAAAATGLGATAFTVLGSSVTFGQIALFGGLMALGGLSQLLTPTPQVDAGQAADPRQSFLFGDTSNVSEEGFAIPLPYGRVRVGSGIAMGGAVVERLPELAAQDAAAANNATPPDPAELFDTNATFDPPASGAGGGGKGGGGSFAAAEDPNTLQARELVRMVHIVADGEIGGLVGGLKSVYRDGTPIQADDDSINIQGVRVSERVGLSDQDPIDGFPSVETEVLVGQEVVKATPVVQTIIDPNADAARIKITLNALTTQSSTSGDLSGGSVELAIYRKDPGGDFVEVARPLISGKTTSQYVEAVRIPLPGEGPWDVKVERITDDPTSVLIRNETIWSSYTRVIDARFTYPDRAVLGIEANAENSGGRVGLWEFDIYGKIVDIPSNYDPFTRVYDGIWDGTFVRNWTDEPVWIAYDIMTNGRYGMGRFINAAAVSKYDLYAIAQYNSTAVPDGYGGTEPRWAFNGVLRDRREALAWLMTLSSVWHGMIYWGPGAVLATGDQATDPAGLVTPSNTINGVIEWEDAPEVQQHSRVMVRWRNPDLGFATDIEVVEDRNRLARFGLRTLSVEAVGCTSRGQARRFGRTLLEDEESGQICAWRTALDHLSALPGQLMRVRDPAEVGWRAGGRVVASTSTTVTIDAAVTLESGVDYTLSVVLPDGSLSEIAVTTAAGSDISVLTLESALPATPVAGAVWALVGSEDVLVRIIGAAEEAPNRFSFTGTVWDPTRQARIDADQAFDPTPTAFFPTGPIPPLSGFTVEERLYRVGNAILAAATASVEPSTDARARLYEWEVKRPGEGAHAPFGTVTSPSIDIRDVTPGVYGFRVRVVGIGESGGGPFRTFTAELLGALAPPETVTGFVAQPIGENLRLSWDASSDLDIAGYRLRHAAATSGAVWSDGIDFAGQLPSTATAVTVPRLKGTWMIKAVDLSGVLSLSPAQVVVSTGAAALNAVETVTEFPALAGTRTNVAIDTGALQADVDGSGDVYSSGTYDFANSVDLGAVYTSRVTASIALTGVDIGLEMDEWPNLSELGPLEGVAEDGFSARLQVRTTDDDPSGTPTWTDWADLRIGDITARAYEFRILFASTRPTSAARVTDCEVVIDMPDRVVSAGDVVADAAGETVTFSPAFRATPSISVTGQDMATGDYMTITSKSRTGFTVRFFNSTDTGISRTFDYVAAGYGSEAA